MCVAEVSDVWKRLNDFSAPNKNPGESDLVSYMYASNGNVIVKAKNTDPNLIYSTREREKKKRKEKKGIFFFPIHSPSRNRIFTSVELRWNKKFLHSNHPQHLTLQWLPNKHETRLSDSQYRKQNQKNHQKNQSLNWKQTPIFPSLLTPYPEFDSITLLEKVVGIAPAFWQSQGFIGLKACLVCCRLACRPSCCWSLEAQLHCFLSQQGIECMSHRLFSCAHGNRNRDLQD